MRRSRPRAGRASDGDEGKGLDQAVKQFGVCDSPRKYKRLDEGKFKFKVRAIDAAGNADPTPAKDKFKVTD